MAMPASVVVPTYTIEDLEHFPDDGNRYELLDGVLLVTPAPLPPHEVVIGRLFGSIAGYIQPSGLAHAVSHGAVEIVPKTHLEPDILVFPSNQPLDRKWAEIRDWWLAVEVFSESSRIYDRDFKRNAYLAMGVAEVWLVDWWDRAVYVSRKGGRTDERQQERLPWHPHNMPNPLHLDLSRVFQDLP
jgi:Uma2 family endonuclease